MKADITAEEVRVRAEHRRHLRPEAEAADGTDRLRQEAAAGMSHQGERTAGMNRLRQDTAAGMSRLRQEEAGEVLLPSRREEEADAAP